MTDHEHAQQSALFQQISLSLATYPELALAFAIPNGGQRNKITAAKMKAEGTKAGIPDIFLPVARQGCHGLWVEMKATYPNGKRGTTSPEQRRWIKALADQGYRVVVCYDWQEAYQVMVEYLTGEMRYPEVGEWWIRDGREE